MGTDLQEVFDAFFAKFPAVDFTGKESKVVQFLKSAIGKCYRKVYEDLAYIYDDGLQSGSFYDVISQPTVELISMYMAKEYATQVFTIMSGRKQHLGTQAFNKLPNFKEEFEAAEKSLQFWNDEIERFIAEFPDYSEER